MRNLPWYKRHVGDWRGGTRGMTMELRGFYSECLDAMWDRQSGLPNDVQKLSVMLDCNPRTVRKLLPQLVRLGKLVLTENGYLNERMAGDIGIKCDPIEGELEPKSSPIQRQSEPNSKPNRTEFDPKNENSSMFSTRVLEAESREAKNPPNPQRGNNDDRVLPSNVRPMETYGQQIEAVRLVDGKIVLSTAEKTYWLEQFKGDATAANLATLEAEAKINPGSRIAPASEFRRTMTRIARESHQRSVNYAAGVERNAKIKLKPLQPEHKVSVETRMNVKPAGYGLEDVANG